ncbi:helix-turn-helix domain-containing protein [Saccharicrinis sp. FJH54]|uniref:AlbA family DNA-binding domain-containing protein n=1 Tax=Saccharicrinis sp. FJH54 TaxID=3344665 RepID=UPI0035D48EA5
MPYTNKILQYITEGEHVEQDFKFEISDSRKIARSLAAFANTQGGRLLVGVKDNGNIAGVRSEEEFYMIEAAAHMYCKPPVPFQAKEWDVNGKTVLEIKIAKSDYKLHTAPDNDGKFKVYIRVKDQNLLANAIYINAQKQKKRPEGKAFLLSEPVKKLLDLLNTEETVTAGKFKRLAEINSRTTNRILTDLVAMNIIRIHFTDKLTYYSLVPPSENDK